MRYNTRVSQTSLPESSPPMPHRNVPLRRALAAVAGAIVALLGTALTQSLRHEGGLLSDRPEDRLLMLPAFTAPIVVAFVLTYVLTRWKPRFTSGWLATVVTLAAYYTGTTALMAVPAWTMHEPYWPKVFVIAFFAMLLGLFIIGPWSLAAGWATFYGLDRAAVKAAASRPVPLAESEESKS